MKKYEVRAKLLSMMLACSLAVMPAMTAVAAETVDTVPEENSDGTLPEENTSSEEGGETDNSILPEEENTGDGSTTEGNGTIDTSAPENATDNPVEQNPEADSSKETGTEEGSQNDIGGDTSEPLPLEEEGEVTTPITKEDKPYLALGANLTAEQQATVLELLGINPEELDDYDVIYITNEEEHAYLGEYVSADKIGTRSLSSVLVVKREQGHGINITTKNISYCTIGMYKNALITAGITDADIIVAGPMPISGTAALVGALKAYSVMTGEEVSEESMDAALNELVLTGDIADAVGDSEKAEELLAYLKKVIIENGLDSEEDIRAAIEDACKEFDITLTSEEIDQLITLLQKIGNLDLDLESIKSQAEALYDKISSIGESSGFFAKIADFFRSIIDFFKSLFS